MATLFYGLNVSLDGYVDHDAFTLDPAMFQHWTDQTRRLSGSIYGRRMYESMRYWDKDQPDWNEALRAFATAWRRQPKWVVSRTLTSVGPNATLVEGYLKTAINELKTQLAGEVQIGGPEIAQSLTDLGLIDEYRLYFQPAVVGGGKPFSMGRTPELRFASSERIGENAIRLTYLPA
jgi:dihydrofolate reductase